MSRRKAIKICSTVIGASAIGAYLSKWEAGAGLQKNILVTVLEFVRLCAVSAASIFMLAYIWRQQKGGGAA
jgi:hypothetical protein